MQRWCYRRRGVLLLYATYAGADLGKRIYTGGMTPYVIRAEFELAYRRPESTWRGKAPETGVDLSGIEI